MKPLDLADTSNSNMTKLLAETLANKFKNHQLPAVCERLGLESGSNEEAYASKRNYVKKRLIGFNKNKLLEIIALTLKEIDDPELADFYSEMTVFEKNKISTITRRKILNALNDLDPVLNPLFGNMVLEDGLNLFSIETINLNNDPFPYFSRNNSQLEKEIKQHYCQNPDWDNKELLEKCGAVICSNTKFMRLIETLLHPETRYGKKQDDLAKSINHCLQADHFSVEATNEISGHPVYQVIPKKRGVKGLAKNIIFASTGPKPEIIFQDAINNDIKIVKNDQFCLVYDQLLSQSGLSWTKLAQWWQKHECLSNLSEAKRTLYERLWRSVKATKSYGEVAIFKTYCDYCKTHKKDFPALIPQVYLHYDPYTAKDRSFKPFLGTQRMDFLLLLNHNIRIVIEVDGKHHYANVNTASPKLYKTMALEDRQLRLSGYEVYRFGGAEFTDTQFKAGEYLVGQNSRAIVLAFLQQLFDRHKV